LAHPVFNNDNKSKISAYGDQQANGLLLLTDYTNSAHTVTDIWLFLLLHRFGCEVPIPAHFGEFFGGFDPLNVVGYCRDPQKAHPWLETHVMTYKKCP